MSSMRSASSSTSTCEVGEAHVPLLHQVEQAARRGDDDVDAAAQRLDLRAFADAAEDRGVAQRQVPAVGADVLFDLRDQLARRRHDQRAHVALSTARRSRRSSIGSTKAAVLPVPVCATPMMSRPSRMTGMALAWIGVGST